MNTPPACAAQTPLHRLQVELVLVENPGEGAQHVHRVAPRVLGAEPDLLRRGRRGAGEGCQQEHLHQAALVVVAVGAESVVDLVICRPRMGIGEDVDEVAVDEFRVTQLVHGVAESRPQRGCGRLRERVSSHPVVTQREDGRVVLPDVEGRIKLLLLGGLPRQQRAGHTARAHGTRDVAEDVVLAVRITESRKQLGVSRHDVITLHERLLHQLPVGVDHLGHVSLGVPAIQGPPVKELRQEAEIIR